MLICQRAGLFKRFFLNYTLQKKIKCYNTFEIPKMILNYLVFFEGKKSHNTKKW